VHGCGGGGKSALCREVASEDQDTGLVCSLLDVAWIMKFWSVRIP